MTPQIQSPEQEQQRDLRLALFRQAVQINTEYGFRLKYHEQYPDAPRSPFYINLRELSPWLVHALAEKLYDLAYAHKLQYKSVAGIPAAGEPFAEAFRAIAQEREGRHVPLLKLAKTEFQDGTRKITGIRDTSGCRAGSRVLLIDDLVTHADTKFEAFDVLNDGGYPADDLVVVLDRQQRGRELLLRAGYAVHAAYKWREELTFYRLYGLITKNQFELIHAYLDKTV